MGFLANVHHLGREAAAPLCSLSHVPLGKSQVGGYLLVQAVRQLQAGAGAARRPCLVRCPDLGRSADACPSKQPRVVRLQDRS